MTQKKKGGRKPKATDPDRPFPPKQQLFIAGMVEHGVITKAALDAGYSKKTAAKIGHNMMQDLRIAAEVDRRRAAIIAKVEKRTGVTKERLVDELAAIAFTRMDDIASFGPDGVSLHPSDAMEPEALASIESVSEHVNKFGTAVRIKQHSKLDAIAQLAKLLDYLPKEDEKPIAGGMHIHIHGPPMGFEVAAVQQGDTTAVKLSAAPLPPPPVEAPPVNPFREIAAKKRPRVIIGAA